MTVPSSIQDRVQDARETTRTSLYLAATLYCDGAPSPIKIRNISPTGALVEGAATVGTLVQLVRGSLIVHGLVAWSTEDRCGLKFSGRIDVARWRAAPANAEQQRVDEVVRLVKAGAVPLPVPSLVAQSDCNQITRPCAEPSEDLARVSDLLDELGNGLAADPDVVTRHGPALQNLDIAMQMIAAVNAMIDTHESSNPDPDKLAGLRRSADEAVQRRA